MIEEAMAGTQWQNPNYWSSEHDIAGGLGMGRIPSSHPVAKHLTRSRGLKEAHSLLHGGTSASDKLHGASDIMRAGVSLAARTVPGEQ